jgi:glycosyltransferase involved in cell wall biosynthesis
MAHVGIDARLLHYRVGGISTYIRRLVQLLEVLDEHRFTIIQSRKARESICRRFTEARVWTPPHHRLERIILSAELLRLRLDVLHSPDFIPPYRGARRHVITVHDLTFLYYPHHKDMTARRYYNDQIEWAVRRADHILAVSEATKGDLITMLRVPVEKITVQPHGVDERFKPLPADTLAKERLRLRLPDSYILFVGTLEPRKNIPALLDAYEQLPGAPPLLLVGHPGWLFDDTMARIEKMQARGKPIIIRRDIADSDLPVVYNLAVALALPSFYEGFGLPALEAMACGTPVIVSNCSALPEVVGEVGLQIDPYDSSTLADALDRALSDESWQQMTREAGLRRAALFTWEHSARVALSVYEELASE